MTYNVQKVVGDFFEDFIENLFDLIPSESEDLPDKMAKDGSFFVEVKSGSYKNCCVIKKNQLFRYDKEINQRRFYAFCFHSLDGKLKDKYATSNLLKKDLSLKSAYLFPFSVVFAHYHSSTINRYPGDDFVVKMRKNNAFNIFNLNSNEWKRLDLDKSRYKIKKPFKKINIMTREGHLERKLLRILKSKK